MFLKQKKNQKELQKDIRRYFDKINNLYEFLSDFNNKIAILCKMWYIINKYLLKGTLYKYRRQ